MSRSTGADVLTGAGLDEALAGAPSLAAADVSMSPISAADLSQAQADAVFLGDSLVPVSSAIRAARRARKALDASVAATHLHRAARGIEAALA